MEKQPDESITAFTMRKVRAEIIAECIKAAEKAWPMDDNAVRAVIKAIRALA